jgi:hypothetical protein
MGQYLELWDKDMKTNFLKCSSSENWW